MTTETKTKSTSRSGGDFGLADPGFWAYFRTLSMTDAEQAWHAVTAEAFHAKRQEFYDAAKANIMKGVAKTKSGNFTQTHHEQAVNIAKGAFSVWKAEYERTTPAVDGVANPFFGATADDGFTAADTAPAAVDTEVAELAAWLATQTWSEFAQSLATQYRTRKSLSPKQVEAARSMKAKADAKAKVMSETVAADASYLDLSNLPSGMYAVPGGDTRLKVRVSRSRNDSASGRYPKGTIFVNDDAAYGSRKMYGSQTPGTMYRGDIVEALTAIASDPLAASMAYGRLVGACGVCGRRLEDEVSVAKGIGPICEGKAF